MDICTVMGLATAFTEEGKIGVCEMGTGAFVYVFFFYDIRLRLWSLLLWSGECISIVYGVAFCVALLSVFTWRCGRAATGFREGLEGMVILSGVGDVFIAVPSIFTWWYRKGSV